MTLASSNNYTAFYDVEKTRFNEGDGTSGFEKKQDSKVIPFYAKDDSAAINLARGVILERVARKESTDMWTASPKLKKLLCSSEVREVYLD